MNNPKLYTVKEAARIVGVSTNTLYKYLDEGRLKASRGSAMQGRFRIPETAIEEFLGVKLTTPEPIPSAPTEIPDNLPARSDGNTGAPSLQSPTPSITPVPATLSLKFTRLLLVIALLLILFDVISAPSVKVSTQVIRLFILLPLLLLAYQEGGFRRGIR